MKPERWEMNIENTFCIWFINIFPKTKNESAYFENLQNVSAKAPAYGKPILSINMGVLYCPAIDQFLQPGGWADLVIWLWDLQT